MTIDRKKIKKYFEPLTKISYCLFIGGILGFGLFYSFPIPAIVSVIAIGIGGWMIYDYFFNKPTDEQMDSWLEEDLERLEPDSLSKARMDKSELVRTPVTIYGPRVTSVGGAEFYIRKGKDKRKRYSPVEAIIIHFTEHQLITYQCAIDLTTGNSLNVRVKRFFYKDVVSAETESKDFALEEKSISKKLLAANPSIKKYIVNGILQLNGSETFKLTTSAGTFVEVALRIPQFIEGTEGDLSDKLADQAISAINKMLLSKKI